MQDNAFSARLRLASSRSTRRWRGEADGVKFPKKVAVQVASRHPPDGRAFHCLHPFQHDSSLSLACSVSLFSSMPAIIAPSPRPPPQHFQLLNQDPPPCNLVRDFPPPLSPLIHPQHPRTCLSPPRLLSPFRLHDPPYVAFVCPARLRSCTLSDVHPTELQITHPMWSTPQETRTVSSHCSFHQAPSSHTTRRLPSRCLWASIHIRSPPLDLDP